jgi:hypothetical protein
MSASKSARICGILSLLALAACSAKSNDVGSSASADTAQGDFADTNCQVVLRNTAMSFDSSGAATDCSSGTCWVIVTVTFDVAMQQSLAQSEAFVLYQGSSGTWRQSNQAEPTFGAPVGFRRYQVAINYDTFENGNNANNVNLIPYIQVTGGARYFDHNRVPDSLGSYLLYPQDNWTIGDDNTVCQGAPTTGTLALTFAQGWQNSSSGSLTGGGKLDVSYDIYRMPSTISCEQDSVAAFSTVASVQFQPGGEVLSEVLNGPADSVTYKYASLPAEFDIPSNATSAALWFSSGSECTAEQWDSNYGQNYVYTAN